MTKNEFTWETLGAIAHTNFKIFLILYTCVFIKCPHSRKCNIKTQYISTGHTNLCIWNAPVWAIFIDWKLNLKIVGTTFIGYYSNLKMVGIIIFDKTQN